MQKTTRQLRLSQTLNWRNSKSHPNWRLSGQLLSIPIHQIHCQEPNPLPTLPGLPDLKSANHIKIGQKQCLATVIPTTRKEWEWGWHVLRPSIPNNSKIGIDRPIINWIPIPGQKSITTSIRSGCQRIQSRKHRHPLLGGGSGGVACSGLHHTSLLWWCHHLFSLYTRIRIRKPQHPDLRTDKQTRSTESEIAKRWPALLLGVNDWRLREAGERSGEACEEAERSQEQRRKV